MQKSFILEIKKCELTGKVWGSHQPKKMDLFLKVVFTSNTSI